MDILFPKKYQMRRRKYWLLLALVFGFGLCLVEPLEAQRAGGYQGSRRGPGRTGQADQKAMEALEKIEAAAMMILTDNLLQATPLQSTELPVIQSILETNKKFAGKFPKERKAYLYVLESLLAHYSGNREVALDKAKRAFRDDPKNPDLSDLIIVLSLCYEHYEEAKMALNARKAGSAVLGKGPPVSPALVKRGPREPNVPGILRSRPKEPNSVPRPRPSTPSTRPGSGAPSKWDRLLSTPSEQQPSRPGVPGRTPYGPGTAVPGKPGQTTMPGRVPPRPNPRMSRTTIPQQNYQTILNLPVEYMLSKQLGEDFASMNLRSINGSFFPYASGKGQIFCALLWTSSGPHPQGSMPRLGGGRPIVRRPNTGTFYSDDEEAYRGGFSARRRSPMTTSPGVSGQPRVIPNVAFDLDTNVNQFRELFFEHINEGKIGFVGVNYDTSISQVKQMLFEQPLPWPTCLKAEGVNTQQWPLPDIAGALLLLVDTKGKIRYIGPVGGFLPQMLLDMELAKATTTVANVPDIPVMSSPIPSGFTGSSKGESSSRKGILGFLFGGRNKNKGFNQTATASNPEPNVPVRKKPVSPPPTIARKTPAVTLNGSNIQARKLLRTAQVQRRLTPLSALRSCDEVLERWPNSPEAQDAKVMIKSLLEHGRLPNDIKQQRKAQGKYIGED